MATVAIWAKRGTRAALTANPLHQGEPYLATDSGDQAILMGIGDGNNVEALSKAKYVTGNGTNPNKIDHAIHADTVDNATQAALALEANHAAEANHATSADAADSANVSNTSNSASFATSAGVAQSLTSDAINNLMKIVYPVGALKFDTNNSNPATYIPGTTWAAWGSGRVPVGVDAAQTEFNTTEKTGGEKTHQLTNAELPSYEFGYNYSTAVGGDNSGVVLGASGKPGAVFHNTTGGGNQAHNNLPPYITCYIWKRTS